KRPQQRAIDLVVARMVRSHRRRHVGNGRHAISHELKEALKDGCKRREYQGAVVEDPLLCILNLIRAVGFWLGKLHLGGTTTQFLFVSSALDTANDDNRTRVHPAAN